MIRIRRVLAGLALGVVGVAGLAACSGQQIGSTGISSDDAYKIGCPALDSALATGSVANKASIATLKGLRDHADLNAETTKWVDAGLDLLQSTDPKKVPKEARAVIVDGCKTHGYTLQNLKK